ncbi:MAG TPA: ribonuclease III, partial [Clostridiaceae bacterium]|nr:ribonuclease III [Clostridiaceae bacterium]
STWAYESTDENVEENERMEFLGDSVLGLIISTHLYNEKMELPEGKLSRTRAQIVREETLFEVAKDIGLGALIKLGVGEERTGGRNKPSNLSDCLEAVIGAVYLDGGYESCFQLVTKLFKKYYYLAIRGRLIYDFKTTLIERIQAMGLNHTIEFKLVDETGPVHERVFTVTVFIDEIAYGTGMGHAKKVAEQEAAKITLDML